jgi:hypothetical protein
MITVGNARKNHTYLRAFAYPGGEAPRQSAKLIFWQTYYVNHQLLIVGGNMRITSFEGTTRECY